MRIVPKSRFVGGIIPIFFALKSLKPTESELHNGGTTFHSRTEWCGESETCVVVFSHHIKVSAICMFMYIYYHICVDQKMILSIKMHY